MLKDQYTIKNSGSSGYKNTPARNESKMQQSPEIAEDALPPIIEFPKVFLFGKPKLKDQDSDCTKSSGSCEYDFDDDIMYDSNMHDFRRNIMFNGRIVFNLNNRPRFLSRSVSRVRIRMANEDTSE